MTYVVSSDLQALHENRIHGLGSMDQRGGDLEEVRKLLARSESDMLVGRKVLEERVGRQVR